MEPDKVRVHVITYRRVHLLARALKSIQSQTHQNWIAEVINDDPTDNAVNELIISLNDERIFLSTPLVKRGGTGNFNYCFRAVPEPFACILEDDNWFEPTFLSTMLSALQHHKNLSMAVGNETIWEELPNNQWKNTKQTIWEQQNGTTIFEYRLIDKCGRAKICNSSMFWRTSEAAEWQTPPEIPIDVTEHFRERVIPHPILLVHEPLVNFAQTLQTYRRKNSNQWNVYQTLLVASVFELLNKAEQKKT
jgi:glycosyltransferase involved in cell wall biosynthesis